MANTFIVTANPERDQDRALDLADTYARWGVAMFRQQRAIYRQLAERLKGRSVLEAGCGNGVGTAMLERTARSIIGTDKLAGNVAFARELYPWIDFQEWNILQRTAIRAECVVCVETLEHVRDPAAALRNLLDAATHEVWLTTPNGVGKASPPSNPFHVREYTPAKMLQMILQETPIEAAVHVLAWDTFDRPVPDTVIDPLVYWITLR